MAIVTWIEKASLLEWSQIWKNNISQWNNSTLIINNIDKLEQTINNYNSSWDEVVSKKEFSDILKIIKFIMEQDINIVSKMQLKIKEMDEEIKKLKTSSNFLQ